MAKTRIISIANRKGGVGKSTVTMLLAGALAEEKGGRVLILDTDEQQSILDTVANDAKLYPSGVPLFDVEALAPMFVVDYLKLHGQKYDFVFLDAPRVTEAKTDTALAQMMVLSDVVLVPVLGSVMDVFSTMAFIKVLDGIAEFKRKNGLVFDFAGFINRASVRKENRYAADTLESLNLPFMDSTIPDLKIFATPSGYASILVSKGGTRFLPFFNEFCKRFKI